MTLYLDITCPICGNPHGVVVDYDKYVEYATGTKSIQNVLPELSPTEREQIISNICPTCQDEVFKMGA